MALTPLNLRAGLGDIMFRIWVVAICMAVLGGGAIAADAPSGPPSPEEFFSSRRLKDGLISPSGRYLALVRSVANRDAVIVLDLVERKTTIAYTPPEADIVRASLLAWKGDDRLILDFRAITYARKADGSVRTAGAFDQPVGIATDFKAARIVVNRSGGDRVELGYGKIVDILPDDPDHILIQNREYRRRRGGTSSASFAMIERLDVRTGDRTEVLRGPSATISWLTDRTGRPVVRYDIYGRRGGLRVFGLAADGGWQELFSIRERDWLSLPDLEILGVSSDPGKLYVAVRPEDRSSGDTRELRTYDFVSRTMGPRIWSHPKYDVDDILVRGDDQRFAAACYWADVYTCSFTDPEMEREFAAVRRFFDGERSIVIASASRDLKVWLLSVTGPDEPGSLYLYDSRTRKVELIGARYPTLSPDRLGIMTRIAFQSRDGVSLNGYLTEPPSRPAGKLPLIVMPHGGPEARDHYDYDRWAQAFATRGYLVLQPNFRGSGGFGAAFAEGGYRQWGLRMQDDITDGVQSLIAAGRVDPDRICIVGASYGGYASLFGGARQPDLFKCVVSIAGISDLMAMEAWERRENGADSPEFKYWLKAVGDTATDRGKLTAASPITYAQTYRPPVLLLHGEDDETVPVEQSRAMEAALKRSGRSVRLITYPGEDHNGWTPGTEISVLTEMLTFVDKAIGH